MYVVDVILPARVPLGGQKARLRNFCVSKPSCRECAYTSSKSITFIATSLFVSLSSLQAGACMSQPCCQCV